MSKKTVVIDGLSFDYSWGHYSISRKDLQEFCKPCGISATQLKALVLHAYAPFLGGHAYICPHKKFIQTFLRIIKTPAKAQRAQAIKIFERSKKSWLEMLGKPDVYVESMDKRLPLKAAEKRLEALLPLPPETEAKKEMEAALEVFWRKREKYNQAEKATLGKSVYQVKCQLLMEASKKQKWLTLATLEPEGEARE